MVSPGQGKGERFHQAASLHATLSVLSLKARERADALLESTETPQDADAEGPIEPSRLAADFSTILELQRALQSEKEFGAVLTHSGVKGSAMGIGLRDDTPTGDFFAGVARPDGWLSLLVGDACGHDALGVWENAIRFSLFLSQPQVRSQITTASRDPRDLILAIDKSCNFRGPFAFDSIALTHVLMDPASGVLAIANAANTCPVFIVGPAGARRVQAKGAAISHPVLEECGASFLSSEATVLSAILEPDEVLILGTDGLVDSLDAGGTPLDDTIEQRLLAARVWELSPREAVREVFSMIHERRDDVAIVVARRAFSESTHSTLGAEVDKN